MRRASWLVSGSLLCAFAFALANCSKPRGERATVTSAAAAPVEVSACESCSKKKCAYAHEACNGAVEVVALGPMAQKSKSDVCKQIVSCVRESACAAEQNHYCYCGQGVEIDACLTAAPQGVCKDVIVAGSESSNATEIAHRYLDPAYATGLAFELISCEREKCKGPCP